MKEELETITEKDVPNAMRSTRAITFTKNGDVYITKDLAREMGFPEKRILFHFNKEQKMLVSSTESRIGFNVSFKGGMFRITRGFSVGKLFKSTKGITPGTRIVMYDEPVDGYYVEQERLPTRPRGSYTATN